MNFTQIEYFLTLCSTMNFTNAAKELYISQPALSRQIAVLEKELGYPLVDRSSRALTLTPAGVYLREAFQKIKSDYLAAINYGRRIDAENKECISIGFLSGWNISCFIPDITKLLANSSSSIRLSVHSYGISELLKAVSENSIDIAVGFTALFKDVPNLHLKELGSVHRRLFYSRSNPHAKRGKVDMSDFRDDCFFLLPEQKFFNWHQEIEECCKAFDFLPRIETMPNTESMISSMQAGLGVVLLDTVHKLGGNPVFNSIDLPMVKTISAVWKKENRNTAIKAFVDRLTIIES